MVAQHVINLLIDQAEPCGRLYSRFPDVRQDGRILCKSRRAFLEPDYGPRYLLYRVERVVSLGICG